jgi:hypothetical protein
LRATVLVLCMATGATPGTVLPPALEHGEIAHNKYFRMTGKAEVLASSIHPTVADVRDLRVQTNLDAKLDEIGDAARAHLRRPTIRVHTAAIRRVEMHRAARAPRTVRRIPRR